MKRWDAVARRVKSGFGVEVGVAEGKMSAGLLRTIPELTLYMVDRWAEYTKEEKARDAHSTQPRLRQQHWDAKYKRALAAVKPFGNRAKIVRKASLEVAGEFDDGMFDFVFLDADHSYEGLAADIRAWLPKVKKGGYLCGHDYHNKTNPKPGVDRAVDEMFPTGVESDVNSTWFVKCDW